MSDDRTLAKAPLPVVRRVGGTRAPVHPVCSVCGIDVDLGDPDHHVCAPDANGVMVPTTVSAVAQSLAASVAVDEERR